MSKLKRAEPMLIQFQYIPLDSFVLAEPFETEPINGGVVHRVDALNMVILGLDAYGFMYGYNRDYGWKRIISQEEAQ